MRACLRGIRVLEAIHDKAKCPETLANWIATRVSFSTARPVQACWLESRLRERRTRSHAMYGRRLLCPVARAQRVSLHHSNKRYRPCTRASIGFSKPTLIVCGQPSNSARASPSQTIPCRIGRIEFVYKLVSRRPATADRCTTVNEAVAGPELSLLRVLLALETR